MRTDKKSFGKLIFIGVDPNAKGGIASVLIEYSKLFPNAKFIKTTSDRNAITKVVFLLQSLFLTAYYSLFSSSAIFHIHSASYNSFKRKYVLFRIIKLFKRKVVFHVHGGEFHLFYKNADTKLKLKIQRALNTSEAVICLSHSWKDFFEKQFQVKKLVVIPNIIAFPGHSSRIQNRTFNKLKMVFLGRISEKKGVWDLLDALEKIRVEHNCDFELVVGGDGDVEHFQELIRLKNLNEFVRFIGWASAEEKQVLLAESNLFVLPSYNEGLPISILEAMSYELPILSTPVGGIPEVVEQNVNGILITPGNVNELVEALMTFIESPHLMVEYGKNNIQKVKSHFPDEVKKELIEIYRTI